MVTSPEGLGPKKDYAGECQQHIQKKTNRHSVTLIISFFSELQLYETPESSLSPRELRRKYAVVIMTGVVPWLRLALSKGPNRVGISPHTWGRKQIQFPKRTMDTVQKPNNSECHTLSEPFRIYLFVLLTVTPYLHRYSFWKLWHWN
jgi:hypothetical protein